MALNTPQEISDPRWRSRVGGGQSCEPTRNDGGVASIQPELWVERAAAAVAFYCKAFDATVLHLVGDGDDIVAQLVVEDAAFWVSSCAPDAGRFDPLTLGGGTGRTLLVVDDPDATIRQAADAGASVNAAAADEHGWRVGRIIDPFGHEWEIGRPLGTWPPRPDAR
jgi:PhnB protein